MRLTITFGSKVETRRLKNQLLSSIVGSMIRMAVLGSGSGGNATLVSYGELHILVDAGLSAKQIALRMKLLGVDVEQLSAILLTHEHSDHARGIDVLLRKNEIPVYVNAMTREALSFKLKSDIKWKVFQSGQDFAIHELKIHAFKIPHDAAEPVGFTVSADQAKLGFLSDVGHITKPVVEKLRHCDGIYVEANYDDNLLEQDIKRPWSIKQRIQSQHGHLSNVQTAELLSEVVCKKLQVVVLSHLSSDCNCPKIASKVVSDALAQKGFAEVKVKCAEQHVPTEWFEVGSTPFQSIGSFSTEGSGDSVQGELFNV